MQRTWRLREARLEDAAQMFIVLKESVEGLTGGAYSKAQQRAWVTSVSSAYFCSLIALGQHDIWICEGRDGMMGFGALHVDEVSYLYVRPWSAGKGVGSSLLGRIEQTAMRRGERRLYLRSSINARTFYERHGFRVLHELLLIRSGVALPSLLMEKHI